MISTTQEPTAIQRLLAKGWTISDAALFLGVSRQHLYMVLTGRRASKRLTAKVEALPYRSLTRMRRSK